MNVVEPFRRMAIRQPDSPALIASGQAVSYGGLLAIAGGLAASFRSDGVLQGHRVAVIGNSLVRVASTLALGWIGAAFAETGGAPDEKLGDLAQQLDLDAVYAPRELDLKGARARPGRIDALFKEISSAEAPPLWDGTPDALWRVVVSSGTTGRPKGIASPHSVLNNVHLLRTLYPCGPGDVVVIHMNAAMSFAVHNWLRCLYGGACAHLGEGMKAPELLALLQGDQPTHCMVTPQTANRLAAMCLEPGMPAPSPRKRLHTFSMGGGRVSPGVRDLIRQHLCANVVAHYGGAEMQIVSALDVELADAKPHCTGRLLPWMEAQAIGPEGQVLPFGETGRLRFRSPALASGYIGDDDGKSFQDGWFFSQDRGALSPDGLVFLAGRANDVIEFNGRKFDPEMMEEAVLADRSILECAIVDVTVGSKRELAAVIVDPASAADNHALLKRCLAVMPGCAPRHVLRTDKLPRNPNGKLMRGVVRQSIQKTLSEAGNAA